MDVLGTFRGTTMDTHRMQGILDLLVMAATGWPLDACEAPLAGTHPRTCDKQHGLSRVNQHKEIHCSLENCPDLARKQEYPRQAAHQLLVTATRRILPKQVALITEPLMTDGPLMIRHSLSLDILLTDVLTTKPSQVIIVMTAGILKNHQQLGSSL